MNVSLTPELEHLIEEKVRSGMYHSASEVVREGLRLLAERDEERRFRLQELQANLRLGYAQLDRGEIVDGPQALRRLRQRKPQA